MSRVKRGKVARRRHNKVLKRAKGFFGLRKNVFRRAQETVLRAMAYAFKGRKQKKRQFRALFVVRVNAACKANGLSYSKFVHALKQLDVRLNRKMLSQMAIYEPTAFAQIAGMAKNRA